MFLPISQRTRSLLIILLVMLLHGALLAGSVPRAVRDGGYDSIGDYRIYRMVTNTDNACQVYYTPIPATLDNFTRIAGVTLYQATQGITFEPGFVSEDGASFIAEIVPGTFGVPQATNLTGTADVNMNWIQSTIYDEQGTVIGDSKHFFDNNGHGLQSQSKSFYRAGPTTVYTHVLASQPVRDAYGRDAVTTLAAPIDYADFSYRSNFVQHNSTGANYSHQHFDLYTNAATNTDKTNSPDPLWDASSGYPVQGTLAWYYSTYNAWEPYTPVSNYPYSRQTFYQDGTGNGKKSAGVGDPLKMGTGRELSSYVTPVANELDFYIQVRNKFFATTDLGALPTSLFTQAMQTISRDANGLEVTSIQDRNGKTLMTARTGTGITVNNTAQVSGLELSYYFKMLAAGAVSITGGAYTLYDMNTEQVVSFTSGNTLPAGYYKLIPAVATLLTLTYSNSYTDVSYNFYNQLGQLVATIAPEGVKKLYGTNGTIPGIYTTKTTVPFIGLFTYDLRGRLVKTQDPDRGSSQFVYRNDGKIRFSQNAVQAVSGSFSYMNYDALGRIVESGQYQPDGSGIAFGSAAMTGILENTAAGGGLTTGTKTDVSQSVYDQPDNGYVFTGYLLTNYVQDVFNLSGGVSVTRKYSSIVNNAPTSANLVSATWYNYDEEGKTIWVIQYISGLGTGITDPNGYKTTDYTYDVLEHLVRKSFQSGQPDAFAHIYDYDPVNKQLWHVSTSIGTAAPILQATYIYYLQGGLKRVELATNLQGIDYTYTLQGALKSINNSDKTQDPGSDGGVNGFASDAFGEVLDYYTGDYTNGRAGISSINGVNASSITADSYVGNIKAMTWYSEKPTSTGLSDAPTTYVYQYDPKYQFTESTWGTNLNFGSTPAAFTPSTINKEKIGNPTPYDGNGNIQYLQRTYPGATVPDQFTYHYDNNNNQLTSIINTGSGTSQTYSTYTYDQNGQITGEVTGDGSSPKYMVYDVTGKVTAVYRDAAHTQAQQVAGYVYNELGQRIKKIGYNSSGQVNKVTYYVGGVIYGQTVPGGTAVAQEYQISGSGRIGVYSPQAGTGGTYTYEMKDHLGNIRAVIAKTATATYDVRYYADYYPYGMVISKGGTDYRYGYQGDNAEVDPETLLNAFELRMYDSRIARWLQYDPKRSDYSPYVAMDNDPIKNTDPDGGCARCDAQDYAANMAGGGEAYKGPDGAWMVYDNGVTKMWYPDKFDILDEIFFGPKSVDNSLTYNVWNSKFVRSMTPDFINVGGGFSGIYGTGASVSVEANIVMHGPEASWKPVITTTTNVGTGFSVDATFNLGFVHYTGDVKDIERGMVVTNTGSGDKPTIWGSIGIAAVEKLGVTGTYTPLKNGSLIGLQVNYGAGLPAGPMPLNGAVGGVSNTFLIYDFGAVPKAKD